MVTTTRSCRIRTRKCLQGAIAGSKKHTLKAAGHMFFWEVPEETVRVAGDFLAAVK